MGFFPGLSTHREQTQDLHSLQKTLEAAAQPGLAAGGEEERGSLLRQEGTAAASTPTSLPSEDVRAWSLAADESARLPGGAAQVAKGVAAAGAGQAPAGRRSVSQKLGEGCKPEPVQPGHRPSHSCAGYSAEATANTGKARVLAVSIAHAHPSPGKASGRQPWGPGESAVRAWGRGFSVTTSCGAW